MPEIICSKFFSQHHNNLLAGHFEINKTRKLVARTYYWPTLCYDVKAYIKGCNIYLTSKAVCHKPYGNLQLSSVPTHCWKNLLIDFVTGLPMLTDWKSETYNLILVIIDRLTKIVYYKPVKIPIDASSLAKVIINAIVYYHGLPNYIVSNQRVVFTSKFWSLLCYLLGIKCRLSITFYPQTNS